MSNKITKYPQIPDANEHFVLKTIWELLYCFKLLDEALNYSCDENPYIYLCNEDEGDQGYGRAKVCLTNLHLQVTHFPNWRSRVSSHLQTFQHCNRIPPLLSDWYRNFASATEESLFNPFLNHVIIPFGWTTIVPVPQEVRVSSQTLQCMGFGWSTSMWEWGYRFFHPMHYRQKIVSELRNIFLLHKLFPKFFTEVLGVACDYYIVPIGPSYGQNIAALDHAIYHNPILLTRLLFDCLLLLHILYSQGLRLNSMNNADLIFMFDPYQPRVQIRNPEIIERSDNLEQGIAQNLESLKNLVRILFRNYHNNTPNYLIGNQLINQILDGWDLHHQCFGLIQNYFSHLNRSSPWSWLTLNAFDRFEEKSKRYLIILTALTRLNLSSQPRLYFENAIGFQVEDGGKLSVTFSEQHTLMANDILAFMGLLSEQKIVAYFQDFLRALNLLHRNNIYYMEEFQLHKTVGIREGIAEFHLVNFDKALMTTGFHEENARHDLETFSHLVGTFLVRKPIRSFYHQLHAALDRMRQILPTFEVNPNADYLSLFNNFVIDKPDLISWY